MIRSRYVALAPLLAACAVACAEAGQAAHTPFAREMHAAMETMQAAMALPMSGDPDIDFLAMMIPHHEAAIEMARLELVHGNDPLARRLAEEIIASQHTEIAAMRQRLAALRERKRDAPEDYPALGGTRGR